jgi:hypothetical protein
VIETPLKAVAFGVAERCLVSAWSLVLAVAVGGEEAEQVVALLQLLEPW